MPSHRKRPTQPPARRPQVAGLRRPGAQPSPRPRPAPYSAQYDDVDAEQSTLEPQDELLTEPTAPEAPEAAEPEAAEPEAAEPEVTEPEAEAADAVDATEAPAEPEAGRPKPSPRAKARDTGVSKPTTAAEEVAAEEPAPEPAAAAGRSRDKIPFGVAIALAAVFAVAAGVLAWLFFRAEGVTANKAQSDAVTTAQISTDVRNAVQVLFSYDYAKLDDRNEQVNDVLASDQLKKEFATLNCAVREQAPKQKIVTLTRVTVSAVTDVDGDTARVIGYVDNVAERGTTKQRSGGGGALDVTAKMVDGKWRIAGIDVFGAKPGDEKKLSQLSAVPEKCK